MNWHDLLDLVSPALLLFVGGRYVGRIESAVTRITSLEKSLENVPKIETKLGQLEELYKTMRSDHKELARKVNETREQVAHERGRSQGDFG